jgi:hypothetical protein
MRIPEEDREERRLIERPPAPDEVEQQPLDADPAHAAVTRLQRTAGNTAVSRTVAGAPGGAASGRAARQVAEALVPGLGRGLDPVTRRRLEGYLGRGLGEMRLHTGARAGRAARAMGARAFAAGNHVVFAEGAFDPGSAAGRELLVHEATHVVQQDAARRGAPGAVVSGPRAEEEAQAAGRAAGREQAAPEVGRAAAASALQGDQDEATREEWRRIGDIFESDEESPGPVVLAEGLAQTSVRVKEELVRAGALTEDAGEQGRLRRVGDELEKAEKELPELVVEIDAKRLPDIRDALKEMVEGLDKVEELPDPAEQRVRAVQQLTRVTKAAGRLEGALPNGGWRTRLKALADLGPLVLRLAEAPVAAGGGDGEDEQAPEAE